MLCLVEQAAAYERWQRRARVHTLAAGPDACMAHYHALLDEVPEVLS